jgi:hypothetical protein
MKNSILKRIQSDCSSKRAKKPSTSEEATNSIQLYSVASSKMTRFAPALSPFTFSNSASCIQG